MPYNIRRDNSLAILLLERRLCSQQLKYRQNYSIDIALHPEQKRICSTHSARTRPCFPASERKQQDSGPLTVYGTLHHWPTQSRKIEALTEFLARHE